MATDKIKVAIRVRPFNKREKDLGTGCVVKISPSQTTLTSKDPKNKPKTFSFDACFDSIDANSSNFSNQNCVFDAIGTDILENAFKGYNACIFAYGQTGSGKSYTMMGSQSEPGIIPKLCGRLFEKIAETSTDENQATAEVSYMEIYNEKVFDLLDWQSTNKSGLKVREHNVLGPYVDGLSQLAVEDAQEIEDLMTEGNKSRTVAATNMNSESSRSHAVFSIIITFHIKDTVSGVSGVKVSRVSLVDLAGSERANKTGAMGDRLKEGSNINKSLTTLGLVISKLADQSAGKSKENFVPYRDSTLTWLLKDNLGGNSRTVMVATISPAADNYEETLSTLRYADRAKRITNHAVVNEDPNARIIRDLRSELETLKEMLLNAANPDVLMEKLNENESIMKEMSLTWEEKLKKTGQNKEDRRQALEKMGVHVESSGIKVEKGKHFLVNLSSDPSLNELLVYYLKDETKVGTVEADVEQDIQLMGIGIKKEHCIIELAESMVFISPLSDAKTCVNGKEISEKIKLFHGDRILWGSNHFFRVNCPTDSNEPRMDNFDWNKAQEEVMMADGNISKMDDVIANLEKKYKEEKQAALDSQKREYEKQYQQMKTSKENDRIFDEEDEQSDEEETVQLWLDQESKEKGEEFKRSLEMLKSGLIKATGMVREANFLATEMKQSTSYSVTLQIPPENLSPNSASGIFINEPSILVNRNKEGRQIWSMEKLNTKLNDMVELYEQIASEELSYDEIGKSLPDPFFDAIESHTLIGVANLYLRSLFSDVKFEYNAPILSQDGQIAGKLLVELERIEGSFPADRVGLCGQSESSSTTGSDEPAQNMKFRIQIKSVVGLPPAMAHFVFCQYTFWKDQGLMVVPSLAKSTVVRNKKIDAADFRFSYTRDVEVKATEQFRDYCDEKALSIEIYGHKSNGFYSAKEAAEKRKKAQTIADRYSIAHPDLCWICFDMHLKCHHMQTRWSEMVRNLELWVEIQEINEYGKYTPVDIQQREDIEVGGILQLRQGQQRRIQIKVKPVPNSGNLPIVCETISNIQIGSISARSKLQKPLNSYQEDDLSRLREDWATSVASLKERLDGRIHKLYDKKNKSKEEFDLEQSLIDQKNCIIDELNKVLVPSENSRLSNCFMSGMELLSPIIFLNTSILDSTDNLTELDEFLPIIGDNCFLPKEQTEEFFDLPIIGDTGREVGAVASWDSSVHESPKLNRVTPEQERLYLIIKAVVRLSDPVPMDLVLRKRICISIYKRQSISSFLRKSVGYAKPGSLRNIGTTFEVVGNVPNIYNETDWKTENEEDNDEDSETYEETFFDKYTQAVTRVETVLSLERLKQGDMVTELVTQKEIMNKSFNNKSLKKAASISNIRMNNMGSTRNLSGNFGSTRNLSSNMGSARNLSGSQTSLNAESIKRHKRQSMGTVDLRDEIKRQEQKQKRLSMPTHKMESFADNFEKGLSFDKGSKLGTLPVNANKAMQVATIIEENT